MQDNAAISTSLTASPGGLTGMIATVAVQSVAAAYFLVDGLEEANAGLRQGIGIGFVMECLVGLALILAIAAGASQLRCALDETRRHRSALLVARGAISELAAQRFRQWGLSRSEAEVALFALKGCSITEIAQMRGAAEGTVRSQLSQVYAKAQVSSQSMLIAQFVEDLL